MLLDWSERWGACCKGKVTELCGTARVETNEGDGLPPRAARGGDGREPRPPPGSNPRLPRRLDCHGGPHRRTENQKAWFFVLPVLLLVAFNALVPMMTVVNSSVQETFGNNQFFWHGVGWFQAVLRSERLITYTTRRPFRVWHS